MSRKLLHILKCVIIFWNLNLKNLQYEKVILELKLKNLKYEISIYEFKLMNVKLINFLNLSTMLL